MRNVLFDIRCYFVNSLKWLNEVIEDLELTIVTDIPGGKRPGMFLYEEWALYGTEEALNVFRQRIKDGDYDVEIESYKEYD